MHSELWHYIQTRSPTDLGRDLLDVLITYYIFYRVALVLRGTRAMQMVAGLALVFILYVFAELLRLGTVLTLLTAVLSSAILIGVVVFQNDIRRGLMRMGARAQLGGGQSLEAKLIEDVVEAATILARHRTGAIMTFEQDANLDEFVGSHTGHIIDAAISPELLVSMFIPEAMNKLHDGAVIIRDLRIAKAGVFFPMPEGRVTDESFGSRHRAAMGITEETDAVVVVVSEERGTISFCFNGNIIANLDGPRLRAALEGVFATKAPARHRPPSTILGRLSQLRSYLPGPNVPTKSGPVSTRPQALTPAAASIVASPSSKRRKSGPDAPAPLRKKKGTSKSGAGTTRQIEEPQSEALRPSYPPGVLAPAPRLAAPEPPRSEDDTRHTLVTGEIAPVRLPPAVAVTATPLPGPTPNSPLTAGVNTPAVSTPLVNATLANPTLANPALANPTMPGNGDNPVRTEGAME